MIALGDKPRLETLRTVYRILAALHVQPVREQLIELYAEHPALSQQCAVLLDDREKALGRFPGEHDRFAEHRTDLRSADVEHVAVIRDSLKRHIRTCCGKAVAKACTVKEQRDIILCAHAMQRFKLRLGVERPVLRGGARYTPCQA